MIERNELNTNARGGTELMQEWLEERLPAHLKDAFQIIATRVRTLSDKPRLLWLHGPAEDEEAQRLRDPAFRKQFAKLIFVSNWLMQKYAAVLGVPHGEGRVIQNAIEPIAAHTKPRNGVKLIYHTTPSRGLDVLVPVFMKLCELHDDIELDVFSSYKVYGWEHMDRPFEALFDACRNHPRINYHGAVSNAEIRKALQGTHIFAYPGNFEETSCIAMIEAMSAGLVTVCPNLGALPETAANFAVMYAYQSDPKVHANYFGQLLHKTIKRIKQRDEDLQSQLQFQKRYFDRFYSWDRRIGEWVALMEELLPSRPKG